MEIAYEPNITLKRIRDVGASRRLRSPLSFALGILVRSYYETIP